MLSTLPLSSFTVTTRVALLMAVIVADFETLLACSTGFGACAIAELATAVPRTTIAARKILFIDDLRSCNRA